MLLGSFSNSFYFSYLPPQAGRLALPLPAAPSLRQPQEIMDSKLLEEDKSLSMVYHNESGKPITLISTHGGIKVRETLVQLKNLLSK